MIGIASILLTALLFAFAPIAAFACVEDEDDTTSILFGSPARDRERDNDDDDDGSRCLDNGLKVGSYFDEKGRIVGSPCDPVQYCSDPSSTDVAVVDYCSDTWDEQGIDRRNKTNPVESENDWKNFCEANPAVVPCNPNDAFVPPTPPEAETEAEDETNEEEDNDDNSDGKERED